MVGDIEAEKRAMRAEVRERRRALSEPQLEAAAAGITEQLDRLVQAHDARSISCYLSSPMEPGTRPFINAAMDRGLRVLLPVTRADGLLDWTVASPEGDEFLGPLGIAEPTGELLGPMAVDTVDLLLIPAAAVGADGNRLGWGRGYFDKTLGSMTKCPPVYAVLFDSELVDEVPREIHDRPVDGVVTPTRTVTLHP
ncbi:5-formyltetrahydrofolate cyclo-ligase [Microbacterium gorillae]|uniref:5-formyltetrahydrofolate cyclo-ligase n=1 Tax=Microbacterium gorillae TaxID=1231063 RepID=UPI00058C26D5|nr:5-formyltetrahydrofolate cyclo-ligase [Microbacterium gorillae]